MSLRTPLSEVRGHGSAKDGTHHWWVQRLSGVALIPLTIWFVFSVACMVGSDASLAATVVGSEYVKFSTWAAEPFNATCLILLVATSFHHAQLGVQVVIEDYIHGALRTPLLVAIKLLAVAFAVGGILAVLKIAL
ncbi:succinate dehydrogenase, hydrophobic membrane anchor protein [Curvivirga aplysinae]|uniref:succinate dehydrogenase, hydrophobic membrane anchor protein n=1 Tax=Curvivirga aplysinae TaxID=2529852 RepID=UPI0012BB683A|nr:succinate dehydrogenase, hydrophobic membrane anchor protein [Curvivirga aplysinae]MTI08465.1 succinate dehydrogenase, hydrophobic membrane anchor protein [Curvivirga aplysinae]